MLIWHPYLLVVVRNCTFLICLLVCWDVAGIRSGHIGGTGEPSCPLFSLVSTRKAVTMTTPKPTSTAPTWRTFRTTPLRLRVRTSCPRSSSGPCLPPACSSRGRRWGTPRGARRAHPSGRRCRGPCASPAAGCGTPGCTNARHGRWAGCGASTGRSSKRTRRCARRCPSCGQPEEEHIFVAI